MMIYADNLDNKLTREKKTVNYFLYNFWNEINAENKTDPVFLFHPFR